MRWLLTIGIMGLLYSTGLAQVLPAEEGLRENGGFVKEDADFNAVVEYVSGMEKSDREKVILLSGWFYKNMTLDLDKFVTGESGYDYLETMKVKKGVCSDFVILFGKFCERLNIVNDKVEGSVPEMEEKEQGVFYRTNHVWNVVCLDGEWWNVDMLWAIGGLKKKSNGSLTFEKRWNPQYVLTKVERFMKTHIPADPMWQLTDRPYPMAVCIKGDFECEDKMKYDNYKDSIMVYRELSEDQQRIRFARRAHEFNPANKEVVVVTFYNEGIFLLNCNRRTQGLLKRVREYFKVAREFAKEAHGDVRAIAESIDERLQEVEAAIK